MIVRLGWWSAFACRSSTPRLCLPFALVNATQRNATQRITLFLPSSGCRFALPFIPINTCYPCSYPHSPAPIPTPLLLSPLPCSYPHSPAPIPTPLLLSPLPCSYPHSPAPLPYFPAPPLPHSLLPSPPLPFSRTPFQSHSPSPPLTFTPAGAICFDPPLPAPKQRAIGAVRMGCAVKVLMAFSSRVWPAHLFDIVCTDSFLPEVWFTRRSPSSSPTSSSSSSSSTPPAAPITAAVPPPSVPMGQFLAVGFAAGDAAEDMARLPPQVVLSRALEQLDTMFRRPCSTCKPGPDGVSALPHGASGDSVGTFVVSAASIKPPGSSSSSSSCPPAATPLLCTSCHPASACFVSGCFADWSKDVYIRGAYTHPTIGAGDARDQLAAPLAGKLFFAGEATHFGVNPCMQGALDTGTRVANEVFWSLQESKL
ncbi:unnamed protein product [Closterium sp. NIES-53]